MASVSDLVSTIQKKSELTSKKIEDMIEDKCIEFSGMITKEAAAHLVARELGVDLPRNDSSRLQIKNLIPGMRNVNVIGRIVKISPINEFQKKNGDKGKVSNLFISDGTGQTRVPLWNDQVKMVEEEMIKAGDVVQVFNGMSKENMYGDVEISVGKFGGVRIVDDESLVPSLESMTGGYNPPEVKQVNISELVPGKFQVTGTIVQVFRGKFVFENDAGEKGMVISCIVDDGTGDIRMVFFRKLAEEISGLSVEDFEGLEQEEKTELARSKIVGKEVCAVGNVKKNQFFDALEIVVDSVKDLNPLEESKRIVEELEAKIGV